MLVLLYIVVSNLAFVCYGMRFCEPMSGVELVRLWQIGLIEVMFEVPTIGLKIYRRVKDKFPTEDRSDKVFLDVKKED
jgi:hypothetical protein